MPSEYSRVLSTDIQINTAWLNKLYSVIRQKQLQYDENSAYWAFLKKIVPTENILSHTKFWLFFSEQEREYQVTEY